MLGLLGFAIATALGQHAYYGYLSNREVDQFVLSQSWVIRIGTAFGFLFQSCLVARVGRRCVLPRILVHGSSACYSNCGPRFHIWSPAEPFQILQQIFVFANLDSPRSGHYLLASAVGRHFLAWSSHRYSLKKQD